MRKFIAISLLLIIGLSTSLFAQETYFGKNKVRYKDFDWNFIQTRHFDIHYYEDSYPTAKFCATVMEEAYVEITSELDYVIQDRIPIFIYNSHNDFQQTNIISSLLPEGVGGFTEAFKNRIVIPFTGSYEDFRHVLHHELTHAVIYDMLFGRSFSSIISRQRLFNLPLWFAEGYAEYSSRHGWDYFADMFVRDATITGYLTPPMYLGGFLAYKEGQALVKYIADKYGEDKLGEILRKGKIHLTMNKALKAAIGVTEEELWKEFSKEMKRRYWPSIANLKEADEIGKPLTHARKDGSYFNEKPTFSPDGDKLAIFTDKSDYTEIVLISAADGKQIKRLVNSARSGDLESLHSFVSGMSFSPDGRDMVFVAKSQGKETICLLDVDKRNIYAKKRLDYHNISSPAWSPDGKKIAFSALETHKRDIYVLHLDSDRIEQVTDDRFDDTDPSWMPDSEVLLFSSDRPHPENPVIDREGRPYVSSAGAFKPGDFDYGTYNIFKVGLATRAVAPVNVGPGQNKLPKVSADGTKVAFISNRNGIDNIFIGFLDSTRYYAVTDILTGVRGISWSPDGEKIAYSAFFQGAFDIFLLKDLVPAGDNGILAATAFVEGKYDLLDAHSDSATSDEDDDTQTAVAKADPLTIPEDDWTTLTDSTSTEVTSAEVSDSTSDTPAVEIAAVVDTATTTDDDAETDTTAVTSTDTETAEVETGIYGDEYVYVGNDEEAKALDSLLIDVPGDSARSAARLVEPAKFDSIQPKLPSGEYRIKKYKVRFTPDFVGGGFSYDTFFGMRGQSYFVFSDYLGNHQIYVATDLVNSIDQSYLQAFYFNNKKRTSLGGGVFHTKNYYVDSNNELFSDRFYGVQVSARRPFSIYGRVELGLGEFFIDRSYPERNLLDDDRKRSSKVTTISGAYVFDNVLWGSTGPVNGRRAKLTIDGGKNLFDNQDIEFYSIGLDYRKYWHFKKTFSMAFRVSGGASFGKTPKRYFLGGTTNWIGSRTLDPIVYEVENLYFSDVVTPLRGQPYYELSGDRYALINWEFRFPTIQYFAMRYPIPLVLGNVTGAIFMDVGSAWEKNNTTWNDVKTGFGVGLRMNLLGFALLRYDLAWSTDWRRASAHPTGYFSFGADF